MIGQKSSALRPIFSYFRVNPSDHHCTKRTQWLPDSFIRAEETGCTRRFVSKNLIEPLCLYQESLSLLNIEAYHFRLSFSPVLGISATAATKDATEDATEETKGRHCSDFSQKCPIQCSSIDFNHPKYLWKMGGSAFRVKFGTTIILLFFDPFLKIFLILPTIFYRSASVCDRLQPLPTVFGPNFWVCTDDSGARKYPFADLTKVEIDVSEYAYERRFRISLLPSYSRFTTQPINRFLADRAALTQYPLWEHPNTVPIVQRTPVNHTTNVIAAVVLSDQAERPPLTVRCETCCKIWIAVREEAGLRRALAPGNVFRLYPHERWENSSRLRYMCRSTDLYTKDL